VYLLWLSPGSSELVWGLTGRCNAKSERAVLGLFFHEEYQMNLGQSVIWIIEGFTTPHAAYVLSVQFILLIYFSTSPML
jgi:hypothetical protein